MEFEELEFTLRIGLKVDLRECHVDLLELAFVRRISIKGITHHQETCKPPLHLNVCVQIRMGMIPIQTDAVLVDGNWYQDIVDRTRGV